MKKECRHISAAHNMRRYAKTLSFAPRPASGASQAGAAGVEPALADSWPRRWRLRPGMAAHALAPMRPRRFRFRGGSLSMWLKTKYYRKNIT